MLGVKLDTGKDHGGTVGARVDSACVAVVGRGSEPPQELPARTRALTLVWLFAFGLAAVGGAGDCRARNSMQCLQ
jgi:hypothetical protein